MSESGGVHDEVHDEENSGRPSDDERAWGENLDHLSDDEKAAHWHALKASFDYNPYMSAFKLVEPGDTKASEN